MGIYRIINIDTGKFYIGKSKNLRGRLLGHVASLKAERGCNQYLQRAWNKSGSTNFRFEILEEIVDFSTLSFREKYYVEFYKPDYNVVIVTDEQWTISDEGREHFRQIRLNCDKEWNRKIGLASKGKPHSKEHTERMRRTMTGKKHKQETIEKMRKASIGRKLSESAKQKISRAAIGNDRWKLRVFTDDAKARIGAACKARWAAKKQLQLNTQQEIHMKKTLNCYIASGWFNPEWLQEVEDIKSALSDADFEYFSPKDFFCCPPGANSNVQESTFRGNLEHLQSVDFVIGNTRNKDTGTLWELGFAYAHNKPIVYFCAGLSGQFNLMLSRSGIKVCTSIEELRDYLQRCRAAGCLLTEEYTGLIE